MPFAILPNLFVLGPLGLLAAIWPALFGGALLFTRRYLPLLSITSAFLFFPGFFLWPWLLIAAAAITPASASLRGQVGPGARRETWVLALGAIFGSLLILSAHVANRPALMGPLAAGAVLMGVGTAMALVNAWRYSRRGTFFFPPESLLCLVLAGLLFYGAGSAEPESSSAALEVVWIYDSPLGGTFDGSPLVTNDRVIVTASHGDLLRGFGACYTLDRGTGKIVWTFRDNDSMLEGFSSPQLSGDCVYFGEGLHHSEKCKLYCIDAQSGKKRWSYRSESHVESTPTIADGVVYVGAGDDGLLAIDASKGTKVWNAPLTHVDADPVVRDGHVFAGGADSFFCLKAENGDVVWLTPFDLPAHGCPCLDGDRVFVGLCRGSLVSEDEKPAGGLACLDTRTGRRIWQVDAEGSVFGKPLVDNNRVVFGSRDGYLYCVEREDGRVIWKTDLRADIVSRPILVDKDIYAVTVRGTMAKIDAQGELIWLTSIDPAPGGKVRLLSTAHIERQGDETLMWIAYGIEIGYRCKARLICVREKK